MTSNAASFGIGIGGSILAAPIIVALNRLIQTCLNYRAHVAKYPGFIRFTGREIIRLIERCRTDEERFMELTDPYNRNIPDPG